MSRFLLSIMAILLACSVPIVAHGKGWRGIVPLRSKRADVERLLGPGINGHYQFDKERAHVNYAEEECNPVNGCLCLVPEGTVISIYVQLEVEMKFSKLNIDKKKYEKFVSRKDPNVATYSNDKDGVIYTVNEENDDVTAIEYTPTAKDCKDVMNRAKRTGVRSWRQAPNVNDRATTKRLIIHSTTRITSRKYMFLAGLETEKEALLRIPLIAFLTYRLFAIPAKQ